MPSDKADAVAEMSNGEITSDHLSSCSTAPASELRTSEPSTLFRIAPLDGHEVEAVAHRVDEEHITQSQRGERTRVVILRLPDDGSPVGGAPPLIDLRHPLLDLVPVGRVRRDPFS